ncbi:unnamed protein product [Rhizophagus irregularis]|uniref:Uncharacterized protein n=3 Tax=Rhizophagus irregularis TaxID=588596 RepID=U9U204_RHIID|nr:hypothetical protein GLOIN_2v1569824 [Rhizophagus irregularis DAOM 181602=DAOM 197198]EXX76160.1 hypothetical protein RirG_035670 [Rhizophagus irregularis DAOM 197198w]PKC75574.1 hypothetical protein RhiirA1_407505 [Rhizophagus irregularis]PKY13024.1 hypothetical protein RhiirB3_398299 [Rhizophagus irregularis]PKY44425.1 hypothetical protein RhiirA4_399851 [Rhizophagus irregularis]POG75025.1 hypothetical protein GLOIN_2v1569824 [Rhizophagus irregularis DAOM 181602=DAOM 197198]|eukprot:XP_025181891.1 hypothetical protein GLOIN_2v1569824 [Rhizophagus irregularis DAOM 181602=DAOM 197198]
MTPDLTSNEENSRLRNIAQELCNQLAINREQTKLYKKQINELKGRVEECGGPLYRQNYRGPPFDTGTDIERQNSQLIYQNQTLNEENAALTAIVKEYEQSLKTIMMKFRYQAYEIQQSKLEMQRNYEILLEEQRAATAQVLSENALLQSHLSNLGNLVREAYNAQSDTETDILVNSLITENQGLRQMLKIADGSGFSTSSSVVREEENNVTGQEG